ALVADWRRDHDAGDSDDEQPGAQTSEQAPPFPDTTDAFMSLVEAGWDTDAAARPHGAHTTVVMHLDVEKRIAALHLGAALTDADRRYLLCDATCEVWFERHGTPIGAGRTTRTISRRLRRALEYRDKTCVVPGCGATRGLHAHHLVHWENGGPTDLSNLVLLCPFHHRLHHKGDITLTGPADKLVVTDSDGDPMTGAALARPPTTAPPDVPPCRGPLGERAQWWWYTPFDPNSPLALN
ncbi:HNH endonuclease signature motif containing protein, partial [Mycolicibacterium diernhoferi]